MFFVALAIIALLALPYAAGDAPVWLDRPLSFLILAVIGWVAFAIRRDQPRDDATSRCSFRQRAYGLWLAAIGLILLSRAVYDMQRERRV